MINNVTLCGRITRDLEIRYTQSEKAVCNFSIAVQVNKEEAQFFNCVAWNGTAEIISQYCNKGDKIVIIGHLNSRTWETDDGDTKYITEIVVDTIEFASQAQGNNSSSNNKKNVVNKNTSNKGKGNNRNK